MDSRKEAREGMKKSSIWSGVLFFVAFIFAAGAIYAGTKVPDMIEMNSPGYEKHTKGIVPFSHKKHSTEYKATCGDCHHDDKGQPLTGLKEGDDVKKCIECHKKPGEKPKGKDAPKLTPKEELEYHAEAMHTNCQGCHKEAKKQNPSSSAPVTCVKCHPKSE